MTELTTCDFKLASARALIERVGDRAHYLFVGNNVDPSSSRELHDSPWWTLVDPYRNMIMGKRIEPQDACLSIRDVPWEAGIVYDMYDDRDPLLMAKSFYVSVKQGDYTHVFKCLDNDNGSPSTSAPDFFDVGEADEIYQTADGYRWKYMYTVDEAAVRKFKVDDFIPLVANSSVSAAARPGTIDVIRVDEPGAGYRNHLSGTFQPTDLRIGGNSRIYTLSGNDVASTSNGFYTGCVMYLSSGEGAGQFRRVTNYFSNSQARFVVIDSSFDEPPTNGTQWEISPEVIISGANTETMQARARALVNAAGNGIYRVEMLSRGEGYSFASARVVANSVVGVTPASVRVISPPRGGHGFDAAAELGCVSVTVSSTLSGSESNTVPYTGDFGQAGILKNPVFSPVTLTLANAAGVFFEGDDVRFYDKKRLYSPVAVELDSPVVSAPGFDEQVVEGDWVYVTSGADHAFGQVESVNSTSITLDSNVAWACTEATAYSLAIGTQGKIIDSGSLTTVAVSLDGSVSPSDEFFTSMARGVVETVSRGGEVKGFDTFVQAVKVRGTYLSGQLQENERVWQGANSADPVSEGYVHSAYSDGSDQYTVYLTRTRGQFLQSLLLRGASSGAIFSIVERFYGEVVPGSGPILQIQNLDRVSRAESQRERFKFTFSF